MIKQSDVLIAKDDTDDKLHYAYDSILFGFRDAQGDSEIVSSATTDNNSGDRYHNYKLNGRPDSKGVGGASYYSVYGMVQDSNGFGYISMGYDITTSNVRKINFRTHQVVWEKTVDGGNQSYWGEPDEEYFNGAGKCVLTKDEKYLYVISGQDADDYTIHKFRASDGAIVWQAGDDMHSGADGCFPTDIAVDSDGNAYVTYYQPSTPLVKPAIRRYNYDDGDVEWEDEDENSARCVAVTPDGRYVYVGFQRYWDTSTYYNLHKYGTGSDTRLDRWSLTYLENGSAIPPDYAIGHILGIKISNNNEKIITCHGTGGDPSPYSYFYDTTDIEPSGNQASDWDSTWHLVGYASAYHASITMNWFFDGEWLYLIGGSSTYIVYRFNFTSSTPTDDYYLRGGSNSEHAFLQDKKLLTYEFNEGDKKKGSRDCGCFLGYVHNVRPYHPDVYVLTTDYIANDTAYGRSDYIRYRCLSANGPGTTVYEPGVTADWETYWEVACFVEDEVIANNEHIIGDDYAVGVYKFASKWSESVHYFLNFMDATKKLTDASPKPFRKWDGAMQDAGSAAQHSLADYNTDEIGSMIEKDGSYYNCDTGHDMTTEDLNEPPDAAWGALTAPSHKWDSYNGCGGYGFNDDPYTTPRYYTVIVTDLTGDDAWLNGIYWMVKNADTEDGTWRYLKQRIGREEAEIYIQLGVPSGVHGGGGGGQGQTSWYTYFYIKSCDPFDVYDSGEAAYAVNAKVTHQGMPFISIQLNGTGSDVVIPLVTTDWQDYWTPITAESTRTAISSLTYFFKTTDTAGDSCPIDSTYYHYGCVYELHNTSASAGTVSWYPGAVEEWDSSKTYADDKVVVYSNRFYQSTTDSNTSTPGVANWTLLANT